MNQHNKEPYVLFWAGKQCKCLLEVMVEKDKALWKDFFERNIKVRTRSHLPEEYLLLGIKASLLKRDLCSAAAVSLEEDVDLKECCMKNKQNKVF